MVSRSTIIISNQTIGSQTVPGFGFSKGFTEITGLHSVIPYHSINFAHGTFFASHSNNSIGHLSAPTITALNECNCFAVPAPRILLKNVGVAAIPVACVCSIILASVVASFGSGEYTTRIPVIKGHTVVIVNQKL